MARLSETFPTLDCSQCILTPRMVEVANNPNITLMTYSEVESVAGFVGNFEVTIRRKARYVDLAKCTGCGECWNKCPNKKIPSEFDARLGNRTAIYRASPQAVPNQPVIDAAELPDAHERAVRHLRKGLPAPGDQLQGRRRTGQGEGRRHRPGHRLRALGPLGVRRIRRRADRRRD